MQSAIAKGGEKGDLPAREAHDHCIAIAGNFHLVGGSRVFGKFSALDCQWQVFGQMVEELPGHLLDAPSDQWSLRWCFGPR